MINRHCEHPDMHRSHPLRLVFRLGGFVLLGLIFVAVDSLPATGDPGELYRQRRAVIVAKFDKDGDGRLDAGEREVARAAKKQEALRGGRNPMFQMPPEIVEMYDKDKDGQLNDEESRAAGEGIRIRWEEAQKEFDANGDGNLDDGEREKMGDAISSGRVKGLPRMFGGMLRRRPGGGRGGMFGGGGSSVSPYERFDADKNGRLSEVELAAARKAGAGQTGAR